MSLFGTRLLAFTVLSLLAAYTIYSLDLRNYLPVAFSDMQFPLFNPSSDTFSDHPPTQSSNVDVESFSRRIVAVGDIHGDLDNALKVLNMAGVVDDHGDWTGNIDLFVQTGDIIDRGDDTIELFAWMDVLRAQAEAAGGAVVSLLGNHEWMNVIGDWRYVTEGDIDTFGSIAKRQEMLTRGAIGQSWLLNYSTTARVPLHPSLGPINTPYFPSPRPKPFSHAAISFVHGGLAPEYGALVPYPSRINDIAHSLLEKLFARQPQPPPHPPNRYPGLPDDATKEEHELYGASGPLWHRDWAYGDEEVMCSKVDDVLEKIGVRRMIMGHSPDFHQIVSRCGGKVIVIDTGISHHYGGRLSALFIEYNITRSEDDRTNWKEVELVKAIYMDGEDVLVNGLRTIEM